MTKILIVDDEPDILDLLARGLPAFLPGASVTVAESAEAAQERIEDNGFQLIITDERMPGKTGCDLLAWIRERHPECRRVLMSAFSSAELAERAKACGAQLLLSKPFGLAAASQRLRTLLSDPSAVEG